MFDSWVEANKMKTLLFSATKFKPKQVKVIAVISPCLGSICLISAGRFTVLSVRFHSLAVFLHKQKNRQMSI